METRKRASGSRPKIVVLGEVLGAQMVGPGVTELIAAVVVARRLEATAEEAARTVFANPTLPESIMEAALAAAGRPIHIVGA